MSMHKKPLTPVEESGLRAHGLDIGTPSQLSDVLRLGVAWGQKAEREERVKVTITLPDVDELAQERVNKTQTCAHTRLDIIYMVEQEDISTVEQVYYIMLMQRGIFFLSEFEHNYTPEQLKEQIVDYAANYLTIDPGSQTYIDMWDTFDAYQQLILEYPYQS